MKNSMLTNSNAAQLEARGDLWRLFQSYPGTPEDIERSLGLFIRGSLLARLMAIQEVYQEIVPLPGSILDIGAWRGQTAVMCENLRAVLEPLNFQRRVHAFDTFSGGSDFSAEEKRTAEIYAKGTYDLPDNYAGVLKDLLVAHERNNVSGHVHGKHTVWKGDCRETLSKFAAAHPGEMIALAWIDLNSGAATQAAFDFVISRLVPGGIVAFWQLTRGDDIPAEGMHYIRNVVERHPHTMHKARTYPSLCYLRFGRNDDGKA